MSVIVKQLIECKIDIQALKTVLEMAGHAVRSPGHVTLHSAAKGTHQVPVTLHVPAEVLAELGLKPGYRNEYGLGLNDLGNGEVEVLYDAFYASRDLKNFIKKLGNLSKVARLKGNARINVLYNPTTDQVQVQVAAGNAGGQGNAFMPGKAR